MITRTPFARAVASVILAGALLTGTAGCTFIANQATLIPYDPSDGVGANLGNLQVRNVIAIINEDGDAVSLVMSLVNSGSKSADVNLQVESDGAKSELVKTVPGNSTLSFGNLANDETQIIVTKPGVRAGALLPVYVQSGSEPGAQLLVPVLEARGVYADLAPVPAPTPTPTPTPTPEPTETPAAEG